MNNISNPVLQFPPADPASAHAHFAACLSFETDCADVHAALSASQTDFVLADVRSPALYETGHIAGAINLPYRKIDESYLAQWPEETVFVVYCAGPHCNGAHRAALRLSALNRPVKLMIGGVTGWLDEGYPLESLAPASERA
jgi:rhodanese-related sulfurtransferase